MIPADVRTRVMAVKVQFPRLRVLADAMVARLLDVCADELVEFTDVIARGRLKSVVRARHRVMLILREETSLSFPEIGRLLDRDHTTVMAGCRRALARLCVQKVA